MCKCDAVWLTCILRQRRQKRRPNLRLRLIRFFLLLFLLGIFISIIRRLLSYVYPHTSALTFTCTVLCKRVWFFTKKKIVIHIFHFNMPGNISLHFQAFLLPFREPKTKILSSFIRPYVVPKPLTFFLLWKIDEDILKKVLVPFHFHYMDKIGYQREPKWFPTFLKIYLLVFAEERNAYSFGTT